MENSVNPLSFDDRLQTIQRSLASLQGQRRSCVRSYDLCLREISSLEEEETTLLLVLRLFQKIIDQEIKSGAEIVQKLQTEGLRSVFPDQDIQVRADVSLLRGKVSINLSTVQTHEGGEIVEGDASSNFGGSILSIQSFLLRVLVSKKHGLRPFFLFDETLVAFDPDHLQRMAQFIKALCKEMGLSILMATHNRDVLPEVADCIYKAVNVGGKTTYVRV